MNEFMTHQSVEPKRNVPRDLFLHLFSIVALYWVVIGIITLCFQYINYFFPTLDEVRYGYQSYLGPIRFSVSSLIIIFPLFIASSWYLHTIYRLEAIVRESKIRKWLIYLTLFIASLIMIGDLVTIIYSFLGGEVTTRFVLKALSIFIVMGAVFGYYLDDVRRSIASASSRYYALIASVAVFLMVVGAFFIVGSPSTARLAQIDYQRVNDLQNIQGQIVNYYQKKGQLPVQLEDLNDSISGYFVAHDPETKMSYEYRVINASLLSFEFCATFSLDSVAQGSVAYPVYEGGYAQNWDYKKGRTCFERTIDKKLYPILK